MSATDTGPESSSTGSSRTGRGRGQIALIALGVGFFLGVVLLIIVAGNPFSTANEVTYRQVTVGSVSEQQDSLCWSSDPADRDATRECAILALDPQSPVPQQGDTVTIGLVQIAPPNADSRSQIVYAALAETEPDVGDGAS